MNRRSNLKDFMMRTVVAFAAVLMPMAAFSAEGASTAAPAPSAAVTSAVSHPLHPEVDGTSQESFGGYAYDGAGNIKRISRDTVDGNTHLLTGDDVYVYDKVNRLVSGTVRGGAGTQTYAYDSFGNRGATATTGLACVNGPCQLVLPVSSATNRLNDASVSYHVYGNLQTHDSWTYVWDEAGMMTKSYSGSVSTPTAASESIYGPDDERLAVHDAVHGTWTWDVRGSDGKVLREFASDDSGASKGIANWSWKKDYVYRDGLLLASVSATSTNHYHLDHLGTPRLITDAAGARVAEHDYYPFGAEVALPGATETPQERMKFTGHERDVIPGDNHTLDYMHARYYSAALGRFLTIDPHLDSSNAAGNAQRWNRYTYVCNSSLTRVDPDGADDWSFKGLAQRGLKAYVDFASKRDITISEGVTVSAMGGILGGTFDVRVVMDSKGTVGIRLSTASRFGVGKSVAANVVQGVELNSSIKNGTQQNVQVTGEAAPEGHTH